jgi:zinc protease
MRPLRAVLAPLVLFVLAWGCGAPPAPAPAAAPPKAAPPIAEAPTDPLDEPLPLDARVKKGRLDNGLTYYVLPHRKPENRAQIWLAVNTGSVMEDDDQRGLAHFVEHMCFNGTKRFPKQSLIDFVEKSGVRFGADLNAYTSFDETVYMLQVPTDKPEVVGKGLNVLRDWADGVTFDPEEVEKERGVVLEEWRLGRGAGMRIFDKQAPTVFPARSTPSASRSGSRRSSRTRRATRSFGSTRTGIGPI